MSPWRDESPGPGRAAVGIRGFDVVSGGGLPAGRATLLAGTAGSGKTVFAMQFLAAGAARGEPGVLVTFEERPADLLANVAPFGWKVDEHVAAGRIAVVDAAPEDGVVQAGAFDLSGLLVRIEHATARVGARRLVIDAVDAVFAQIDDAVVVRRELARIVRRLRSLGLTTLISAERASEEGDLTRHGVEQFVLDNVVVLRNTLGEGGRRRSVEVLKQRGFAHNKGAYPFVIDPGHGIEVVPVSEIEADRPAEEERISLGNAGLDAMCGDGMHRDALVLVSGATGTGKSLMGIQFLDAGNQVGEAGILFSFEERPQQIVRNAASWGFDLGPALQDGRLWILSRFAARAGVEDLLVAMKREIDEHGARRIVLDSVTALEHGADPRALRDLVIGLSAYTKSRGIATMMITTPQELMGGPAVSGADLSTLTDAIVLLRYVELGGEMRRAIMVLKMRGVAHDRALREFTMSDAGMAVGAPLTAVQTMLGGTARVIGGSA